MKKFVFSMQIKIEVFTPNKKFACLCNISRKNVSDELDFLPEHKHRSFLQVDIIISGVRIQVCPKYPK